MGIIACSIARMCVHVESATRFCHARAFSRVLCRWVACDIAEDSNLILSVVGGMVSTSFPGTHQKNIVNFAAEITSVCFSPSKDLSLEEFAAAARKFDARWFGRSRSQSAQQVVGAGGWRILKPETGMSRSFELSNSLL